jgi:predicted small lipoprotein YifL
VYFVSTDYLFTVVLLIDYLMKNYLLLLLLAAITGCGQVGPLYLPDAAAPPVYVPKPQLDIKTPPKPQSEPEKTQ